MSGYTLQRCEAETDWKSFLQSSPQSCVYCEPAVLASLGCEADFWFILRSGFPAAAVPVITRNDAGDGLPMHSYYVGPMLHRESWDGKANRRTENLLAISEAIMQELSPLYDKLQFCLHPTLTDVRGFDWFNYHEPERGRVAIAPRYTAECRLDDGDIRGHARSSRRREERYAAEREGQSFHLDGTPEELVELWRQSLERQDCTLDERELAVTRRFAGDMLAQDRAVIAVTRDAEGEDCTAGMMLFDNERAHLPVVGTTGTRYGGTLLYFSLMDEAASRGCRVLDLNGANSPSRGYFKHSIGGEARLYFTLAWSKPS